MKRVNLNNQFLRLGIYGTPGAGKTTLLGTAELDPRTAPALIINASGNPTSLRKLPKQPYVITLDSLKDLTPLYDFFHKGQPSNHRIARALELPDGFKFKTLIFDSVTEVQRHVFRYVQGALDTTPDPGATPNRKEWGDYRAALDHMVTLLTVTCISKVPLVFRYCAILEQLREMPGKRIKVFPKNLIRKPTGHHVHPHFVFGYACR